jgi:DtxR family transcriptional regulator, Mn-dependent transcriptional regulator
MADRQATSQMEEYLEALGRLEERSEPSTTSALARECKVSPPAATQMLQRMGELGLVNYTPREGVILTQEGRKAAAKVMRRHRLWERFLHDFLGIDWDSVHEDACLLEHATSPHVEEHLAEALGERNTCPHGYAIPGIDEEVHRVDSAISLADLGHSQRARVVRIRDEERSLLRKVERLGLTPGAVVQRVESAPEGSEIAISVGGHNRSLDRATAAEVLVEPLPASVTADQVDSPVTTLAAMETGETCRVGDLHGGRGFVGRCLALGFTPGTPVTVVQNCGRGPLIAQIRDVRVALGRAEAQRIDVRQEA